MFARTIFGALVGAVVGASIFFLTVDNFASLHASSATKVATPIIAVNGRGLPLNSVPTFSEVTAGYVLHSNEAKGSALKHLPLAFFSFAGVMAAVNAFVLFYFRRSTEVSFAAMAGEKDEEMGGGRRQALLGASAAAILAGAAPAHALFGFGENADKDYVDETTKMVNEIKSVLILDSTDPTKPAKVATLRTDMNAWVAKYRRDSRFSGRASFGNLYSVINAVAGHYINFGTKTPIPKKRAAQIVTEINQCEQLLSKGR